MECAAIILKSVREQGEVTWYKKSSLVKLKVKEAVVACFSFRETAAGLPNALTFEFGRNRMKITNFLWVYLTPVCNHAKATAQALVQLLTVDCK